MVFAKILIANRGEIAVRIIRACRELGISPVAVYSEADRDSLHVRLADEAVCIGPSPASRSYLNMHNIISAAKITGAEAIHPGYGFLAENPHFAEMCAAADLTFIGPPASAMKRMGAKASARETMQQAGVPIIPGSPGVVKSWSEASSLAREIGFPIMVKASTGGGGRGMRIAHHENDLKKAIQLAQKEAGVTFGDERVYLEKYLEEPRHIEMQIVADKEGRVVYLGERDCSVQRRHQKILEEAPSVSLSPELREKMGKAAVAAAKAVNYHNLGTVEFLLDRNNQFYFMEMNTRLQVEHPVTEMVTGIDLGQEQIKLAAGIPLAYRQEDIIINGWAIECRINAEDPEKDFLPAPGTVTAYLPPGGFGIRVDSCLYPGYTVPSQYDSLLGKLIAWGETRNHAIERMKRALEEFVIEGVPTTIPFHLEILDNAFYRKGEIYTNFIQRRMGNKTRAY
ncbi:MAG: acetyl-CoA carboxylase biotin carboxylase subunit [Clostridia bacterium]|jgi:acetyl-CoA carboxylase biotin carboxylase subunit|nr:acetyl-CoA carboxylase biotin carboxylase subunit [Clostridia bacterium]